MARTVSELRVFVASPDDVKEERGLLEETISDLNITWGNTLGLRLDLVKWETHCWPSISTDIQANVNEQIKDDYDIFIGIMWKKFGTPTPRSGSGTVEEFERAYARYKQDQNALRIMFYFKDTPPSSMSEIDPKQWLSVNEFRKQLKDEKGVLYWEFKDQSEFKSFIQMHLSRQVQEWGKSWGIKRESTLAIPVSESIICGSTTETDNGEGFLDLIELGTDSFNETTEIAGRIAEAIQDLGIKIDTRSKEMNGAKGPIGLDVKIARRIGDRIADDMESFVARMNTEIPLFTKSLSTGISAIGSAAVVYTEFENSSEGELISAREGVQSLKASLIEPIKAITHFRNIIDNVPRLTTKFNRSKKHLVAVLNSLLNEMQSASNLTSEIEKVIDKAIEGIQTKTVRK
jgi:hypothetical protein